MLLSTLFPLPRMFSLLLQWQLILKSQFKFSLFCCPFPLLPPNIFIGYLLQTRSHFYDSTYLLMVLYLQQAGNSLEANGDILVMSVSPAQGWYLEPVNDKWMQLHRCWPGLTFARWKNVILFGFLQYIQLNWPFLECLLLHFGSPDTHFFCVHTYLSYIVCVCVFFTLYSL